MSDINQNVNINVNANTQDANQDISKLENSIATLDGAINLVGGSVEFLAGALVLSGAASEEQAEQFESVALGAIAVADGANRALQGYKILKTETQALSKAQAFLNSVFLANPIVGVTAALAALTAGIALYLDATSDAARERKLLNEVEETAIENAGTQIGELEKLKDRINDATTSEEDRADALEKLQELIPDLKDKDLDRAGAIEDVTDAINSEIDAILKRARVAAAEEQLTEIYKERFEIQQQISKEREKQAKAAETEVDFTGGFAPGAVEIDIFQNKIDGLNKELEKSDDAIDFLSKIINENYTPAVKEARKETEKLKKEQEEIIEIAPKQATVTTEAAGATKLAYVDLTKDAQEATETISVGYANAGLAFLGFLDEQNEKLLDFYEEDTAAAISATLGTAANFTQVLADSVDTSTKEGFEASKKYKIASVITSGIQASFEAFGAAQAFGPILGPILGAAQVAAIAIASNKAIQDIQSTQFGASSSPSSSPTSTPNPNLGGVGGATGGTGVPQIPGFGTSGVTTLNAVVLAGDVTSAQAQDAAIRNRRRFGRGG